MLIISVFCVLRFSCFRVCSLLPCGRMLDKRADLMTLVGDGYCIFVTFPCGILGQVWYLYFNALFILQGFQTALGLLVGLLTCNNLQTFMTIKTTYIYT